MPTPIKRDASPRTRGPGGADAGAVAVGDGVALRYVHAILGLILVAAGAPGVYGVVSGASGEDPGALPTLVLSEAELFGGVWLLGGRSPGLTRLWAASAFTGLASADLLQALAGRRSCPDFGGLAFSPWLALVLNASAVAALLACRPAGGRGSTPLPPGLGFGFGFGLAAAATLVAAVAWQGAGRVNARGVATSRGQPLDDVTLEFVGNSGTLVTRTARGGGFRLPPVRPGLYCVSVTGGTLPAGPPAEKTERGRGGGGARPRPGKPAPARPTAPPVVWAEIKDGGADLVIEFP